MIAGHTVPHVVLVLALGWLALSVIVVGLWVAACCVARWIGYRPDDDPISDADHVAMNEARLRDLIDHDRHHGTIDKNFRRS